MKNFARAVLVAIAALMPLSALAQIGPDAGLSVGKTPVQGGSSGQCLYILSGKLQSQACGTGAGTVTSVSVTTANGVSGSVATPTTTPAISLTLGAITPTTVNGNTLTTGSGTLTLGAGKVATISNTLTFTGTDGSSVAFGTGGTVFYTGAAAAIATSGSASDLIAGTVAAARGGAGTINGALKGNGSGVVSQAACADISNASVYCPATQGQLPGIASNVAASAGNIGEAISSTVVTGSHIPLTNATAADVTSIPLTAGDWDVSVNGAFDIDATTSLTQLFVGFSQTSATLDTQPGVFAIQNYAPTVFGAVTQSLLAGPWRVSLNAPTTLFFVARGRFTVSTLFVYGSIQARRTH